LGRACSAAPCTMLRAAGLRTFCNASEAPQNKGLRRFCIPVCVLQAARCESCTPAPAGVARRRDLPIQRRPRGCFHGFTEHTRVSRSPVAKIAARCGGHAGRRKLWRTWRDDVRAPGIGLAATQVDVHKRVIVMDVSEARDELRVFINPCSSRPKARPSARKAASRCRLLRHRQAAARIRCARSMRAASPSSSLRTACSPVHPHEMIICRAGCSSTTSRR